MAGRPAKPTELHKIDGTYRADRNSGAVSPDSQLLQPPEYFEGIALEEWRRIASELNQVNLTTELDYTLLEQYCLTYQLWREAVESLKDSGCVQVTSTGYSQQTGYFTVATKLAKELRDIAKEFGMTPSARGRMRIAPEEEDSEDIESVLSRLAEKECKK